MPMALRVRPVPGVLPSAGGIEVSMSYRERLDQLWLPKVHPRNASYLA